MLILAGLLSRWSSSGRDETPAVDIGRSESSCPDYNASCQLACAQCQRLSRDGCARCARSPPRCHTPDSPAADMRSRRPVRWLHIPKCGATLSVSVLSYACEDTLPPWHIAGMAVRGGRIDVRMARALDARHATRGERCGGRLRMPFDGHRPISARDVELGGLVTFFRRPSQRLISACARARLTRMVEREHGASTIRICARARPAAHTPRV